MITPHYSDKARHWQLDESITFLNHGSFGATPAAILKKQQELTAKMESELVRFMVRELEPMWDKARETTAQFLGTTADNLVFVRNATMGVNTIFHSLDLSAGDEVLTTNHAYGACLNTINYYSKKKGFTVKIAQVPFPLQHEDEVVTALEKEITSKTKLLLIDHITSATATLFPIEKIIRLCKEKGIEVLVDGAHAPGMIDLDIDALGADYYTGNCHKWLCSPKGSAILYVHPDKQHKIDPLQASHVYDLSDAWAKNFFWPGTDDPTACLCVPDSIEYMGAMFGSWEALRKQNRELTLQAKKLIEEAVGATPAVPEHMLGSMANICLGKAMLPKHGFNYIHPVQSALFTDYKIEAFHTVFPRHDPHLWVRIVVQAYNDLSQYEYLAEAYKEIL